MKLEPCPHCGMQVTIEDRGEGDLFVFLCPDNSSCMGSGMAQYGLRSKKAEAVAAWNRRTPPTSQSNEAREDRIRIEAFQRGFDAAFADAEAQRAYVAPPTSQSDEALVTQDDIDFAKALYATERGTWPESIARWRSSRIASARAEGRREGIEEAAKVCLEHDWGGKAYDAIRALAEKQL